MSGRPWREMNENVLDGRHVQAGDFAARDFMSGGGEMGALMRAHDWSSSSIGPPSNWSQSLRTVVRLMLNTGHPMYIFWGADSACLYNDAYRRSIGPERHPGSLGRPGREVWHEIWDIIGPQIEQVLSGGGATWHEDHLVPITRYGRREDVYWTYSYSPIDDNTAPSGIGGVLVICTETTQKVIEEQRLSGALRAGQLVHWETDLITGTRTWTREAMALFGLSLVDGRGRFGGVADEFRLALHPDDRYLADGFYELADKQDWFPVEYRIRRPDGTVRWLSGGGQVLARSAEGKAQRLINVVADVSERKIAEERVKFLMGEITHRSKNLLSVVQAIASQTGRTVGTFEEFQKRFTQRLQGLAASHDLLVLRDWQGAPLKELVRLQLDPFTESGSERISVSGPDVLLRPEAAEAIGLALHELATNAVKYGALSVPVGRVTISWAFEDHGPEPRQFLVNWIERGGPTVTPPSRTGFGHVVFERLVTQSLNGSVAIDFVTEGLIWKLSIPTTNLVTEPTTVPNRSAR
jgi:two-component sensor histidine kinase/PAS domain-containing protein